MLQWSIQDLTVHMTGQILQVESSGIIVWTQVVDFRADIDAKSRRQAYDKVIRESRHQCYSALSDTKPPSD